MMKIRHGVPPKPAPPTRWTWLSGGVRFWSHDYEGPPEDSGEWIEYIPEPRLVERDGDLWWAAWSDEHNTVVYTQMTKSCTSR